MGLITGGYLKVCEDENRRGGIKQLFVTNATQIVSFTRDVVTANHNYTAVTMDGTAQFFKFEFERREAEYTSEDSNENGSSQVSHTVELFLPKMEKAKAKTLEDLRNSCEVVVIYQDFNLKSWVVGWDEFLNEEAALRPLVNANSGRALTDPNRFTLMMTGESTEIARAFTGVIDTPEGLINLVD